MADKSKQHVQPDDEQAEIIAELKESLGRVRDEVARVHADYNHRWYLSKQIDSLLSSTSWRVSAPLRLPGRLMGRPPAQRMGDSPESAASLQRKLHDLQNSRSWRMTRRLRRPR